jgi:hypothetical protein
MLGAPSFSPYRSAASDARSPFRRIRRIRRAAVPPCRRAAVPPCRRAAVPPCRRVAVPPCRRVAVSPCRRVAVSPFPPRRLSSLTNHFSRIPSRASVFAHATSIFASNFYNGNRDGWAIEVPDRNETGCGG